MAIYKFEDILKKHGATADQVTTFGSEQSIQNSLNELEAKKPSYLKRVGTGIKEGLQEAGNDITSNDGRSALSKGISAVSNVASAVASPLTQAPGIKQVGEVINKGVEKGADALSNIYTPEFKQKLAQMSDEEYRRVTQPLIDTANIGNIADTLLMAKGGQKGTQVIKDGASNLRKGVSDAVGGAGDAIKTQVSKVAPDSATIMNKVARLKPTDAQKFQAQFGKSHGDYLTERGNFKNPDGIIKNEATKFTETLQAKDAAIAKLPGKFKDGSLSDMLDGLVEKAKTTSGENVKSPYLQKVVDWQKKHNGEGLTMEEINLAKRLYEKEVKLGYNKLMNADAVAKSTYIDTAVREFQDATAKQLGFENLPEVNQQIQMSKFIVDKLGGQIVGKSGLNGVSLTDWIMLSGANPAAVAGFLTKKVFSSKSVQAKFAEYLNKNDIKPTVTPSTKSKRQSKQIKLEKASQKKSIIPSNAPTNKTSIRIIPESITPKDNVVNRMIKRFKDTPNKQGGFIKNPLADVSKRIHKDDIQAMENFIDYARNKKKLSDSQFIEAEKLAERFGISMDKGLNGVANQFELVLTGQKKVPATILKDFKQNTVTGKMEGSIGKNIDPLVSEAKKYKSAEEFVKAHTASDLMDLSNPEKHRIGRLFSEADDGKIMDTFDMSKVYGSKGNNEYKYQPDAKVPDVKSPNELVTIYRGTVKQQKEMLPGDFVSFSKDYALMHNNGEKLLTLKVPAKDVIWQGNDLHEWVYSPKKIRDKYGSLESIWEKANPVVSKLKEKIDDLDGQIAELRYYDSPEDNALFDDLIEERDDLQSQLEEIWKKANKK